MTETQAVLLRLRQLRSAALALELAYQRLDSRPRRGDRKPAGWFPHAGREPDPDERMITAADQQTLQNARERLAKAMDAVEEAAAAVPLAVDE